MTGPTPPERLHTDQKPIPERSHPDRTRTAHRAPSTWSPAKGPTSSAMNGFGYRRELSKYEDVDEDELLASLSPEELAELEMELADIDPDANVPIGLRQRDQTEKTPTGTFSRDSLLKYWEKETKRILEDERGEASSPKQVSDQERV